MKNFLVKKSGLKVSPNNDVKTLMLIHGWGMNSQVWQPIRVYLEARYHLIWVDLPGHGFNRDIDAESLDNMVELVSSKTPENTYIMAWSLGGMVAQALAFKIPHKIKSLTLVATTPRFSQLDGDWEHAMTEIVLNRFADNLKQDAVKTLKGFIALQFMGVENSKQAQNDLMNHILFGKGIQEDIPNKWGGGIKQNEIHSNIPSEEALDVGLSILKDADLRELPVSCPEHWVFGEYDRLIPRGVVKDLESLRPEVKITLLKKSGHAPFITHQDEFLTNALDFIEA